MKTVLTVLLILDAPLFFFLAWWSAGFKAAYKKFEAVARLIMRDIPQVGEEIYVPSTSTKTRKFIGGKAKVIGIVEGYVLIEEYAASYRWKNGLKEMQKKLAEEFGDQRTYEIS